MKTNASAVIVSGGLTLSGVTIFLGNAAGATYGELYLIGAAETIDGVSGHPGTITFGLSSSNGLIYDGLTGALTLGANLTVNGTAGQINSGNEPFDNKGTITADPNVLSTAAGTITLGGTNWTNDGTIQAQNGDNLTLTGTAVASPAAHAWTNHAGHTIAITGGGTLTLESSNAATTADNTAWLNLGTLSSNASTVDLGGFFTFKGLGTYNRTGGTVNLTGTLNNAASTLLLNTTTGSWNLGGGTVKGGTVEATAGIALVGNTFLRHPERGHARRQWRQRQSARHEDQRILRRRLRRADLERRHDLSGQCGRYAPMAISTSPARRRPSTAPADIPGTITFGLSSYNGLINDGITGALTLVRELDRQRHCRPDQFEQ